MVYKPISPVPWPYLTHPYVIVLSVNVAILIHLLLEAPIARPSLRFCVVLLAMLAAGVVARPRYCGVGESRRAIAALWSGIMPVEPPPGYIEPGSDPGVASYPWRDYRAVLTYLRDETSPRTRIANVLRDGPALTGPAARLPVFPAESIAWLAVRPADGSDFLAALEGAGDDTLVVWRRRRRSWTRASGSPPRSGSSRRRSAAITSRWPGSVRSRSGGGRRRSPHIEAGVPAATARFGA